MTLPSSGALSLNDIKGEFGGPASPSLGNYYAGGSYVPAGTSGTYGAVPSSGTISIRNFYGTSNTVISITNHTISDLDASDANAYYFLTAGGQVEQSTNIGGINPTNLEQWCTPTSQAPNYEAYITVTSGSLTPGSAATGTWVALSSTRYWYVQESVSGQSTTCIFTVQIRRVGTTTVLDTATITLEASVI